MGHFFATPFGIIFWGQLFLHYLSFDTFWPFFGSKFSFRTILDIFWDAFLGTFLQTLFCDTFWGNIVFGTIIMTKCINVMSFQYVSFSGIQSPGVSTLVQKTPFAIQVSKDDQLMLSRVFKSYKIYIRPSSKSLCCFVCSILTKYIQELA